MHSQGSYPYEGQGQGKWEGPPAQECEEHNYRTAVGNDGDIIHFRQRWHLLTGYLADFAIILMSPVDGLLCHVAELDICHAELHIHPCDRTGERLPDARKSIRPIDTQEDVNASYDQALELMMAEWEHYKQRWRDG
jgi:hypothetical protein